MRFTNPSLIDLTLCIDSLEVSDRLLFCSLNVTKILKVTYFFVNTFYNYFLKMFSINNVVCEYFTSEYNLDQLVVFLQK